MNYAHLIFSGFDWDEFNSKKIAQRLSLKDAENLFHQRVLVRVDERKNYGETRWIALGELNGRVLSVAFTYRLVQARYLVRVISVRYVHSSSKEERAFYEAKKANS